MQHFGGFMVLRAGFMQGFWIERGLTNALVNVDIGVISLLVVDGVDPNLVIFLHIHNTLNS